MTEKDIVPIKMTADDLAHVAELVRPHLPEGFTVSSLKTCVKVLSPRGTRIAATPTRKISPIALRDRILWTLGLPLPYPDAIPAVDFVHTRKGGQC